MSPYSRLKNVKCQDEEVEVLSKGYFTLQLKEGFKSIEDLAHQSSRARKLGILLSWGTHGLLLTKSFGAVPGGNSWRSWRVELGLARDLCWSEMSCELVLAVRWGNVLRSPMGRQEKLSFSFWERRTAASPWDQRCLLVWWGKGSGGGVTCLTVLKFCLFNLSIAPLEIWRLNEGICLAIKSDLLRTGLAVFVSLIPKYYLSS